MESSEQGLRADHPDRELLAALARLMRVVKPADPDVGLLLHDLARTLERVLADAGTPGATLPVRLTTTCGPDGAR